MNVAIILAAGSGSRAGCSLPKQFCEVAGQPIVAYSLVTFENHPAIDEIAVVAMPEYHSFIADLAIQFHITKLKHILEGGKERSDSTRSAISAYINTEANLLFHDAARPFVSLEVISRVVEALKTHAAVATAVPCVDTLFEKEGNAIKAIPNRQTMCCAQTPQAFKVSLIAKAHELAKVDINFKPTDDCGVVLRYCSSQSIFIVDGDEACFKVTYPEDFRRAELWLKNQSKH